MPIRRRHLAVTVLAIVAACLPAFAGGKPKQQSQPAGNAAQQLAALCEKLGENRSVAVVARNLSDGKLWIAHNPDTPLKPASVMKLFATAAAIHRLGPTFQYETRVYLNHDELIIIGSGDPAIGDDRVEERNGKPRFWQLDAWARSVKQQLGDRPLARLVLDDSIFDSQVRHSEWPDDQYLEWYQAPVGGLNLNDNCLDARARVADGQVLVTPLPTLPSEFIINRLKSGKATKASIQRAADSDVFEFVGTVAGATEFGSGSVNRPTTFFGHAMREALARNGVVLDGPVVRRTIDSRSLAEKTPLAVHHTPLRDVVWRANNFSQNLFAECLFKSLSAYQPGGARANSPGSFDASARVIRQTLEQMGVPTEGATFADGSGLGHGNRVSAAQIVRLLEVMRRHPGAADFVESLAVPGRDGTLRRRWTDAKFAAALRAKTGTIRGVSTLAGYVDRPDGTVIAFAIVLNGPAPETLMQNVVRTLIEAPLP
ncbi:MAG: D-alanyl-D-alanine carboxypeptidase/D-alanyl-D-alanine-endopeptidase [Phycisphaerae bacterium]